MIKTLFLLILLQSFSYAATINYIELTPSTVTQGNPVTLSVDANTTGTVSYQWKYKNIDITDWTSTTLTISKFYKENEGYYSCTVIDQVSSSTLGTTVTLSSTLPVLISQSINTTINVGESITIKTYFQGDGIKYQWYKNNLKIEDGFSTSSQYTITNATISNTGYYQCKAYNYNGKTLTNKIKIRVVE